MKTVLIEIRDMEGGDDAKLLVQEMKNIYLKSIRINDFRITSMDEKYG